MSRAVRWFLLRPARDFGLHRRIGHSRLTTFVPRFQAHDALFFETLFPAGDGRRRRLQRRHDLTVGSPLCQSQDETRTEHVAGRQGARLRPTRQLISLFVSEGEHGPIPSHDYQTDQFQ